jgi:hypothetical protein
VRHFNWHRSQSCLHKVYEVRGWQASDESHKVADIHHLAGVAATQLSTASVGKMAAGAASAQAAAAEAAAAAGGGDGDADSGGGARQRIEQGETGINTFKGEADVCFD